VLNKSQMMDKNEWDTTSAFIIYLQDVALKVAYMFRPSTLDNIVPYIEQFPR
jgi:hypothetical protein